MGPNLRASYESASGKEGHQDKDGQRSPSPSICGRALQYEQLRVNSTGCRVPVEQVGRKKVDYFRGKDFKKFLLESEPILTKKCSKALEEALDGQIPQTDQDVVRLGQELIDRKFCYKAPRNQQRRMCALFWRSLAARVMACLLSGHVQALEPKFQVR